MKYYQQGDVIITPVDKIPDGLKKKPDYVLAEGEATGHHHVIDIDPLTEAGLDLLQDENGDLYLLTDKAVTVRHEEHNPITIDPGQYKIGRVREYDHFAEEARRVVD